MTVKTTLSPAAVKTNNKRTFSDSTVLQTLPSGLAEVQFDFALLLRTTGLWAALTRQQRRHFERMTPRLVAIVDPGTRCITGYVSLRTIPQRRR